MSNLQDYVETAEIKASTLYSSWGQSYRYHDIQDLTQELLVVAWLALGTYNPDKEATPKTWVNRRMDYYIQDFVRTEKTRKVHIEYVGDMWDLNKYVEQYQKLHNPSFQRELDSVYKVLSEKQKEILKLKIDGYTHEEIAKRMGYKDNSAIAHQWKKIVEQILQQTTLQKILQKTAKTNANGSKNEYFFNEFMKDIQKKDTSEEPQTE